MNADSMKNSPPSRASADKIKFQDFAIKRASSVYLHNAASAPVKRRALHAKSNMLLRFHIFHSGIFTGIIVSVRLLKKHLVDKCRKM
jgi:hypothetical protein